MFLEGDMICFENLMDFNDFYVFLTKIEISNTRNTVLIKMSMFFGIKYEFSSKFRISLLVSILYAFDRKYAFVGNEI